MSISTNIYLLEDVRLKDVMTAIAFLAGAEKEKAPLHNHSTPNHWYAVTKNKNFVRFVNTSNPEYVQLVLEGKMIDGESHQGHYFFECSQGGRLLSGGSNPFWHAVGIRLVQFFGGYIDLDDCDSTHCDYARETPRRVNNPESDEEWQKFQEELYELSPIIESDLKKDWKKLTMEKNIQDALVVSDTHMDVDPEWNAEEAMEAQASAEGFGD